MTLVLKVSTMNNQTLQAPMEYEFNKSGGTIGRKLSNTWVLPDEQRHLSGSHATIEYDNDKYHIVDTSTNGVFLNGSDKPIGKGNKQLIEDGFQLLMGTFNIEVFIESDDISKTDINTKDNELPKDFSTKDQSVSSDDLFSDLFDDSKSDSVDNLFEPLDPLDKNSELGVGSDDPFFDFDEFQAGETKNPKKVSLRENNESEMDSFFKPAEVNHFSSDKNSDKDQINIKSADDKEHSFFETDNDLGGIPDDWNVTPKDSVDDLLTDFRAPLGASDDKDIPVVEKKEIFEKSIPDDLFDSAPVSSQQDMPLSNASNNFSSGSSSSAFLKGLGLDENSFKHGLSDEQLFLAGKLFRNSIKGTVEVLHSRAEIKNEMRMDMTTIQPIQNNPIKFAVDIDEAIKKLLTQDNNSYMEPEQAMNEVYEDIVSHQLAIISGIQASLSHVLKRFEPKNLITRFEEDSPISANIPVHRKAKLWEAFEKLYGAIETEAEDDFNRLFGQEFAKAYDEQVEMLKNKK